VAVERLSISLPPDLAADIREAAEAAGWTVSVWVMNAARDRLIRDRSHDARERELEFWEMVGPIPEEDDRWAKTEVDRVKRSIHEWEAEKKDARPGQAAR